MYEFTGTLTEIKRKLFQLNANKTYDVTIEEHRKKRSKNANSYLWELVGKIADALGSSKEEIYLRELKEYGQSLLIPVKKGTTPSGYFKYFEYETTSIINGKEADWYKVYKGSSEYNSKEMSVLIDGVVSDCKELDIPTKEDYEIKQLVDDWGR